MNSPRNTNGSTLLEKTKIVSQKTIQFMKKQWISFKRTDFYRSIRFKRINPHKEKSQDESSSLTATNDKQQNGDKKRALNKEGKNFTLSKFLFGFNVGYSVIKNLFIMIVIIGLIGGALVGGIGLGFFASLVSGEKIPTYEEMKTDIENVSATSSMYYATGEKISDLKTDLKRSEIPLSEMSPLVQNAIIATEDEYFYEHSGVVPKAVVRALFQEVSGAGTTSGGSTLTQQLVKQQILTNEVSFKRKANEILLAFRIENYFTKRGAFRKLLKRLPFWKK